MARLKTKPEQREYIGPRARELAKSGEFLNWHDIEIHLRFKEFCSEARHILDNERTREELDRLCKESQGKEN